MKNSTAAFGGVVTVLMFLCGCGERPAPEADSSAAAESSQAPPTQTVAESSAEPAPVGEAGIPDAEATAQEPPLSSPPPVETVSDTRSSWAPPRSVDYPEVPRGLPADLPVTKPGDDYVVLAWNDLGMHCYQADFSRFQILPPYNVYWAQVIARGDKPRVVTDGVEVAYRTLHVEHPEERSNFWQYAAGYGWDLQKGVGLRGMRTSGIMEPAADHFVAEGVPVVDFSDNDTWDPFPMFLVSVRDGADQVVAETVNVAPTSTEMACDLCHEADSMQGTMTAILQAHDDNEQTDLRAQAESGQPVMCSFCHADPAMGVTENRNCEKSLSAAMHGFHSQKILEAKVKLPKNTCQACHPGPQTNCQRDIMSQSAITCTNCHGDMQTVADAARTPWATLPSCTTCHSESLEEPSIFRIKKPNEHLTASAESLYRNSKAHGGGGIYCAACHGSPHAVTPASTERDNEQAKRLQGHSGPIDQCTLCHTQKPESEFWHYRAAGELSHARPSKHSPRTPWGSTGHSS